MGMVHRIVAMQYQPSASPHLPFSYYGRQREKWSSATRFTPSGSSASNSGGPILPSVGVGWPAQVAPGEAVTMSTERQDPQFTFSIDPDAEPVSVGELADAMAAVLIQADRRQREEEATEATTRKAQG